MTADAWHHSRILAFRSPQGALKTGEEVRLSIQVSERFMHAEAHLRLWYLEGKERLIAMRRLPQPGGAWFTAYVRMPRRPGLLWYFFTFRQPDGETWCYGGHSGEGMLYGPGQTPPGYQITVYDAAFSTPRWFREGVMYQIFPDRFKRGRTDEKGIAYHRKMGRRMRVHADWEEQPFFEPGPGENVYAPDDYFMGDLEGIRQSLPYLQSLGATCLYLNPIFESASNHRYDTGDYRRVDPVLGDEGDLKRLCAQARALGIRIMLDGVFSHTGADSAYFNMFGRYDTVGAYQSKYSPYRGWYRFDEAVDDDIKSYHAWWGFPTLPEVKETNPSYLQFVVEGENSLLSYWAGYGVTSWRLDVADELPDEFIEKMRERLKGIDKDGVLLGEVWEDASNKEAYGRRRTYVYGHSLDSVMNYPFRGAVINYLLGNMDAVSLNACLQTQRAHYPKPFYYAAMNMLSTHDSVRAITALGGGFDRDDLPRAEQALFQLTPEMEALAKKRFLIATAIQVAMPGVPCIYYGDEAGLQGMADPFNRGTYPWGKEDRALLRAVRDLVSVRKAHASLRAGYCRMGALSEDVFCVIRYTLHGRDAFENPAGEDACILLSNRSEQAQSVCVSPEDLMEGPDTDKPVNIEGNWKDVLRGAVFTALSQTMQVEVPPLAACLLVRNK